MLGGGEASEARVRNDVWYLDDWRTHEGCQNVYVSVYD